MKIIHQLPGRVRIRIPELESEDYRQRVAEELASDARIKDLRITPACNSLTVYYDPVRVEIKDVMDLLGEEKLTERPAPKKKAAPTGKKARAAGVAVAGAAEPVEETRVEEKRPATTTYFKPAVSDSVQEKIRQIIESEDPQKPYSDGKISELLKEENIEIARRTVAKYREIMGILPSGKRKQLDTF